MVSSEWLGPKGSVSGPQRVKETKKFNGWKCLMLEFGGQHACMVGVRREGYVVPDGAE